MRTPLVLAAVLLLAIAAPAAASWGMPEGLTPRGQLVEDIYSKIAIAGILMFLLVFFLLVWVLVRYREGSGHGQATHELERHDIRLELLWIIVPLFIVGWVGLIAYKGLVDLDSGIPMDEAEMEIKVIGSQWAWEMQYTDNVSVFVTTSVDARGGVSYTDTFHVPADTPILLNITGVDVIHAFNIMDANRAYFSMHDANPFGAHKYVRQVLEFPEGEYLVQCREMCGNPGHAYMRAKIVADSPEDFDAWLQHRALRPAGGLFEEVNVTVTANGFTPAEPMDVAAGTRIIIDADNPTGQAVNFVLGTIQGNGTSGTQNVNVAAGERVIFAFDVTEAGSYEVFSSNGGSMAITAIDATPIDIVLGDYTIDPADLQLEVGTTYLFRVQNAHTVVHNFFIGHYAGPDSEILASSPNVGAGGSASFIYTPEETGSFDTWCQVAGHYEQGMHEHAEIA